MKAKVSSMSPYLSWTNDSLFHCHCQCLQHLHTFPICLLLRISFSWRVAENFEVEPSYLWARDAIKAGKIGDVASFSLTAVNHIDVDTNQWAQTPWRAVPEYQGGFLLDGGVVSISNPRLSVISKINSLALVSTCSTRLLSSVQCSQRR